MKRNVLELIIIAFLCFGCAGNKEATLCVETPADTVYIHSKEQVAIPVPVVPVDSLKPAAVEQKSAEHNYEEIASTCECPPVIPEVDSTLHKSEFTDPYQVFPAMVEDVFAYVDSLYHAGDIDQAIHYLKRFRVIKPLWIQWEARADSVLNVFGKTRAKNSKQFEPIVLQIQNMNLVQSAYSLVATMADSLIALAPGDSLVDWANRQKQQAYANTLAKAQKEFNEIKALADDQGQFTQAKSKAMDFQKRYRDFEESLHIQAFLDYVEDLIQTVDPIAVKYWETHDPVKSLADVDVLISKGEYTKAKELLIKLKASNHRKEAKDKYVELADAYCNKQRKQTSQLFSKAQGESDITKKRKILNEAVASLNRCLEDFPETSQYQKVVENKQFLEKELTK